MTPDEYMKHLPVPTTKQMQSIRKRVYQAVDVAAESPQNLTDDQRALLGLWRGYSEVVKLVMSMN